jgi:hypothetical protein
VSQVDILSPKGVSGQRPVLSEKRKANNTKGGNMQKMRDYLALALAVLEVVAAILQLIQR